jgi:hypothetical protein
MFAAVFILEDNTHRTWIAASMGRVEYISDETLDEIEAEILKSRGPLRRIWSLRGTFVFDEPQRKTLRNPRQ